MLSIIRFKRATTVQWARENPILEAGEPGYDLDEKRVKIGDGVRHWLDLDFAGSADTGMTLQDLMDHINSLSPHPVYDDGPSLLLLYENAKV